MRRSLTLNLKRWRHLDTYPGRALMIVEIDTLEAEIAATEARAQRHKGGQGYNAAVQALLREMRSDKEAAVLEETTVVLPARAVLLAVIKARQNHDMQAERAQLDRIAEAKAFCLPKHFGQQWVRLFQEDADAILRWLQPS
jgi:hypothetical protein